MTGSAREQGSAAGGISRRTVAWLTWIFGGCALALSVTAGSLIELNGGNVGSAYATVPIIWGISFSAVGVMIASRRPENPIGWIFLFGGFFHGLNAFSSEYSTYALVTSPGAWPGGAFFSWLFTWAFAPGFATFPLTLLLFPTGRPPSPRWRLVVWLIAVGLASIVVPQAVAAWPLRGAALLGDPSRVLDSIGGPAEALLYVGVNLIGLSMLASVVSLALRFRSAASVERHQIKWLLYAGALTFIMTATVSPAAPFDLPGFVSVAFEIILLPLALPSIPVAVGIAILKHRLYDIDVVINRTLVYGSLTVALLLAYIGSVVLLQGAFRSFTGQESQLAVVASTLVIAALFNPLRRRIQSFIDRRFYRSKYDAAKTLGAFSAKLRDETDLEELNNELVGVIRETMQPAHVSLWLRPDTASKKDDVHG
jgi:cytochrome b subunit of formate dehydrogenase